VLILEDQGITLYAVWIERPKDTPTYTIRYDGNGHTSAPETVPQDTNAYAEGDRLQIVFPDGLVKAGYVFVGWNTLKDGTGRAFIVKNGTADGTAPAASLKDEPGTVFSPEDIIEMGNEDIIFYAIWSLFHFKTSVVDDVVSSLSITGYIGENTEIAIPEYINTLPVTAIDKIVFDNTIPGSDEKRLTEVTLPSGIITIGDFAFAQNQLREIILPEGLTSIGEYAFYNNQLTEIRIPDMVRSIGEKAFSANALKTLHLGTGVTSLEEQTFAQNQLTQVTLPPGITSLGRSVFFSNSLSSITLGADVDMAFGALGAYDALFREYYNANGKQAGVYEYSAEDGWKKVD
jgi:uncharacterized repeat protein (TIGR02543 family)